MPLIEGFRSRVEPDPQLPPIERLREGLRNFADAISEHPAGYRNLMTHGVRFSEVREALDRARWWRVGMLAWTAYVQAAMLTWLEHREPDRDDLVEILVRALGATAEGIGASQV